MRVTLLHLSNQNQIFALSEKTHIEDTLERHNLPWQGRSGPRRLGDLWPAWHTCILSRSPTSPSGSCGRQRFSSPHSSLSWTQAEETLSSWGQIKLVGSTLIISSLARLVPNSFSWVGGRQNIWDCVRLSKWAAQPPREHLHGQLWQSSFPCWQTISQPFFSLFATASPLIKNGGYPTTNRKEMNPHLPCSGKMVKNEEVVRRKMTFQGKT